MPRLMGSPDETIEAPRHAMDAAHEQMQAPPLPPETPTASAEQFLRYTDEGGPTMTPPIMSGAMNSTTEADFMLGEMNPVMAGVSQVSSGSLVAPKPRDGFAQRWVRVSARGDQDHRNWLRAMQMGWRPRDPSTIPQSEHYYPVVSDGTRTLVRVGDLILCEMPEQMAERHRAAVRAKTQHQRTAGTTEAERVAQEAKQAGFGGLQKQDKVTTTYGNGRRPATMVG